MAAVYLILSKLLLLSMLNFWTSECEAVSLGSADHDWSSGSVRGLQGVHHNSTLPNNGTLLFIQKLSQLTNGLLNELKPALSALTSPPQSTTAAPSTTTIEPDWDIDDFDSCRSLLQSAISRLSR